MRDPRSDPRVSPFAGTPLTASVEITPAESLSVTLGDCVVDARALDGRVELTIGRFAIPPSAIAPPASAAATDVSRWSDTAAALLRMEIPTVAGDEVELRTAMLMLEPRPCVTLVKKVTSGGSTLRMVVADTPDALAGGGALAAALLSPEGAQSLLTALRRVAAAAMDPATGR